MNKIIYSVILLLGILVFTASDIDNLAASAFKNLQIPSIDPFLSLMANFAFLLLVMLAVPSYILYNENKKAAHLPLLAFLASFALAFIIKLAVLRQRPVETINYPLISLINYSFPSMHAMVAFSLLPVLAKHVPKLKAFWIVFASLVSFTRIYFSFHYLSDVFFGAMFGYFIGDWLLDMHVKGRLWKA